MSKRLLHICFFVLMFNLIKAQQYYNNTLYMYNHYSINPAAAGSNGVLNLNGQIRNQWNNSGLDGIRNSYLTGSIPLKKINGAAGVKVISYKTSLEKTGSILMSYAHVLPLTKGNLRLGLDFGGYTRELYSSDYLVKHVNDPLITDNNLVSQGLNANFGVYYHHSKLFSGVSINNLLGKSISVNSTSLYKTNKQIFINGGYSLNLNHNYVFVPSVMIRYIKNSPISSDLNLSFGYKLKTWVGLSFKSSGGSGIFFILPINESWRIGYTYEKSPSPIKGLQKLRAHELNFNYFFNSKASQPSSFRYFN